MQKLDEQQESQEASNINPEVEQSEVQPPEQDQKLEQVVTDDETLNTHKPIQVSEINQEVEESEFEPPEFIQKLEEVMTYDETLYTHKPMERKVETFEDFLDYRIEQEDKIYKELLQEKEQIEQQFKLIGIDIHEQEVTIKILQKKLSLLKKRKESLQTMIENVSDQTEVQLLEELVRQNQMEIEKFEPIEDGMKKLSDIHFQLLYYEGVKELYIQYMNGHTVEEYLELHEKTKQFQSIIKELSKAQDDDLLFLEKKSVEYQALIKYSDNMNTYLLKLFEMDQKLKKDMQIQENQIKQLEAQDAYYTQYKKDKSSSNYLQYLIVILIILFQLSLMYNYLI